MGKNGWGIIGYGVIGTFHDEAAVQAPYAELIAVCDVDPGRESALRTAFYTVPFYTSQAEGEN